MSAVDVTALHTAFAEHMGRSPEGIWAAPGRVNLIGEHTDYNGGFVLPFALPHATYAAASRRTDRTLRVHSLNTHETAEFDLDALDPDTSHGWAAYVAGVFWSLQQSGYELVGVDMVVDTDVPQGAGLSSSAALECSAALAAAELSGHEIESLQLAQIAQRAENDFVGMPCGLMDQMAAMLATAGHAVLFDNRSLSVNVVPFTSPDAEILVVDTKAPHRLVDGEYAARRAQCEQAAAELGLPSLRALNDDAAPELEAVLSLLSHDVLRRRVRHVVTENQRVLEMVDALASADVNGVGKLMNASHSSLRDDYEVSVPEVDLAQETLTSAGAHGARITGGGFGGCVIALVRSEDTQRLAQEVTAAYSEAGYSSPDVFVATPSEGARRVYPMGKDQHFGRA